MLKAPSNEYEELRAGMEYRLALQAIRKTIKTSTGKTDFEIISEISKIIHSMEEDMKRRTGEDGQDPEDS